MVSYAGARKIATATLDQSQAVVIFVPTSVAGQLVVVSK
jgi:hypothetical protein